MFKEKKQQNENINARHTEEFYVILQRANRSLLEGGGGASQVPASI